jgi:hypothetical protein
MNAKGAVPDKAILLKRLRAFYTTRGCRVQTTYFTSLHGEVIEEIELSCLLQGAAEAPPAGRSTPARPVSLPASASFRSSR